MSNVDKPSWWPSATPAVASLVFSLAEAEDFALAGIDAATIASSRWRPRT